MIRTIVLVWMLAAGTAAALTGREVIDDAQRRHGFSTWKDRRHVATMRTYADESLTRSRDMTITEQTDPRGEHRTFIAFTGPADVQGTRFLHLSPRGKEDQQWLFAPTTRRVRRLADAQRDENFFGADLSYRDIELLVRIQQWNDDEATATLGDDQVVAEKPCRVVTLVPKNEEFPAYTKYVLWFGREDALLWRVDVYDTAGVVLKRVHPRRYTRIGSYATALEAVIETVPHNSRTVFEFRDVTYDAGVDETTFSVSSLDRG